MLVANLDYYRYSTYEIFADEERLKVIEIELSGLTDPRLPDMLNKISSNETVYVDGQYFMTSGHSIMTDSSGGAVLKVFLKPKEA